MAEGKFREDLFFRLNVVPLRSPSLRERREDIPALALAFARSFAAENGIREKPIDTEGLEALSLRSWPGNVRELRNVVERAMILVRQGHTRSHHLPADLLKPSRTGVAAAVRPLAEAEAEHVTHALEATGGNIKRVAELLDISRTSLYNKIKAHMIRVVE